VCLLVRLDWIGFCRPVMPSLELVCSLPCFRVWDILSSHVGSVYIRCDDVSCQQRVGYNSSVVYNKKRKAFTPVSSLPSVLVKSLRPASLRRGRDLFVSQSLLVVLLLQVLDAHDCRGISFARQFRAPHDDFVPVNSRPSIFERKNSKQPIHTRPRTKQLQFFQAVFQIRGLRSRPVGRQDKISFAVYSVSFHLCEFPPHCRRHPIRSVHVETHVDFRGNLVHILAPWTRAPDKLNLQFARRYGVRRCKCLPPGSDLRSLHQ